MRNSLLEIVQVELQAWNGIVQFDSQQITSIEGIKTLDKSAISFPHDQLISAILKVCLSYDPVSQEVKTTVRFKANKQFPENMLRFKRIKDNSIWTCSESNAYWSTELVSLTEGRLLDASTLNWEEGESFIDDNSCWQLKLRPAKVRIFVPGIREDLPGWLEINKIEATKGCYIACYSDYYFDVLTWGKEYCDGFSQLSAAGMPPQWSLFKLDSVNKSHPCIDELKTRFCVHFAHGRRHKIRSRKYIFQICPPEIIAEGSGLEERLIMKVDGMQGVILNKNENNRYPIPENAPVDVPLMFELVSGQFVCRLTLVLEEPHLIHEYTLCPRDEFGNPAEKGFRFLIAGAHVFDDTGAIPPYPAQLPTYLANKIIFVGMKAGQISEWPDEMLPYDWDPVWGITKIRRDKWRVHYVGISAELILPGKQNRMNHKWKKWKRVILKNNVEIPNIKGLLQLWKAYVREAASL